jgi:hypothetical protein
MTEPTDAEILALNAGEIHFSESPTKYPWAGHGTQYHAGAPGVLSLARAVLAKWGTPPAVAGEPVAPAEQWDAPTDSGPISRQWLTVVYRGVEAGDEVQQICTHPKVSAMSWSHALHDRDAARSQAKQGANHD